MLCFSHKKVFKRYISVNFLQVSLKVSAEFVEVQKYIHYIICSFLVGIDCD